jgi:phosphohistidine phosphatase
VGKFKMHHCHRVVCRFKYIIMRLSSPDMSRSKLIVRGGRQSAYHSDVLQRTKGEVQGSGLNLEPLGGGRIEHFAGEGKVHVFGYSVAFGAAVHEVTAAILRSQFPLYRPQDVTASYEGY